MARKGAFRGHWHSVLSILSVYVFVIFMSLKFRCIRIFAEIMKHRRLAFMIMLFIRRNVEVVDYVDIQ